MADQITAPEAAIERDRYGRPMVVPPDGGEPTAYTRATTVASTLDDLNGLMLWKQRMTAIGITDRADLQVAVAAHRDDKKRMNRIVQDAMDAAAAGAAATTGTALHSFAEQIDLGREPENVPAAFAPDLEAYRETTTHLRPVHIEAGCVVDELKVHGTPDRVVEYMGECYIADIKSGSIDFPGKIAAQLALYSRGMRYDHATGTRHPWLPEGGQVNQDRAIIIHLPAGRGVCSLHWIDIAAGWEAVELSMAARAWRSRARSLTQFIHNPGKSQADLLTEAIEAAESVEALTALWSRYSNLWEPAHTEAAKARKASLTASAA